MNSNSNITRGFILALISRITIDFYFTYGILERIPTFDSLMPRGVVVSIVFIALFLVAPIPLGIIALTSIKNVESVTKQDRIYKILTKIFAISSLAEVGLIFLLFLFFGSYFANLLPFVM